MQQGARYVEKCIDVTLSYEKLQKKIDDTVKYIQQEIEKIEEKKGKLPKWEVGAKEYYGKRDEITIKDKIGFKTISEACEVLFSYDFKLGDQRIHFYPDTFNNTQYDGYATFFPPLTVYDENKKKIAAAKNGWNNKLLNRGKELIEGNENKGKELERPNEKRIVFAKYEDPLRNNGYKFVGIFKCDYLNHEGKRHYRRIGDKFKIIRK